MSSPHGWARLFRAAWSQLTFKQNCKEYMWKPTMWPENLRMTSTLSPFIHASGERARSPRGEVILRSVGGERLRKEAAWSTTGSRWALGAGKTEQPWNHEKGQREIHEWEKIVVRKEKLETAGLEGGEASKSLSRDVSKPGCAAGPLSLPHVAEAHTKPDSLGNEIRRLLGEGKESCYETFWPRSFC